MQAYNAIEVSVFCSKYSIEPAFIETLQENGLLETNIVSGTVYIPEDQLPTLEKMMRLHYEMNINIEGIETIHYLLQKIEHLQEEMQQLRNRVAVFESLAG